MNTIRILTVTIALLILTPSISQNMVRTELEPEELQYLAKRYFAPIGIHKNDAFEMASKNQTSIYQYEFIHKDSVILRGVIKRPSFESNNTAANDDCRFVFPYDMFDIEAKLILSENRDFQVMESPSGEKFYTSKTLDLLPYTGLSLKDFTPVTNIADVIDVKYYRIDFE